MRFELTDILGQLAVLILMLTIFIKVWSSKLSMEEFQSLLKFLAAVVFGMWLIKKFPSRSILEAGFEGCSSFGGWEECGGWPIFEGSIASLARVVGHSIEGLLTFGTPIAGFLAALYFIMRINLGGYKTPVGVWKTTLGVLLILTCITHLTWIAGQFNEIIITLSNLGDSYQEGRENFKLYMSSLEQFNKASNEFSTSVLNLPLWILKAAVYLLLLIPSVVSSVAYVAQLAILYGVPFSFFLAVFTKWQDLSSPVLLVIRYALISVIKAFTWTTLAIVEVPTIDGSSGQFWDLTTLWSQLPKLFLFTLIFLVAGWILKRFIITPAFTDIFNPRSQL